MVTPSPVAVGEPVLTLTWVAPPVAATVWFAGHEIVGLGTSITVTVKLQEPDPIVELAVTVVVPIGKTVPEAGLVLTVPQSPNFSGLAKVTVAPAAEVDATVISFGHSKLQVAGVPPPPPTVTRPELAVLSNGFSSTVSLVTLATFVMLESPAPAV
jgi:hypothetical protein